MSNVVKFTGKKPEPKAGPYWAGEPMEKAFPGRKARKPEQVKITRSVVIDGEIYFIVDDGPEGAA